MSSNGIANGAKKSLGEQFLKKLNLALGEMAEKRAQNNDRYQARQERKEILKRWNSEPIQPAD